MRRRMDGPEGTEGPLRRGHTTSRRTDRSSFDDRRSEIEKAATCRPVAQKLINPIREIHTCSLMTNDTERFKDGVELLSERP